jgi:hypothetical protein
VRRDVPTGEVDHGGQHRRQLAPRFLAVELGIEGEAPGHPPEPLEIDAAAAQIELDRRAADRPPAKPHAERHPALALALVGRRLVLLALLGRLGRSLRRRPGSSPSSPSRDLSQAIAWPRSPRNARLLDQLDDVAAALGVLRQAWSHHMPWSGPLSVTARLCPGSSAIDPVRQ